MESFPEQVKESKRSLAEMLASDPQAFCAAGIDVLKHQMTGPGAHALAHLLAKENLLVSGLLDATASNQQQAVALAKWVVESGISLQPALEQVLGITLRQPAYAGSAKRILRILDLLAAISSQNRLTLFQTQLMAYPDKTVQSKAALLIGSGAKSAAWIGRHVEHRDARVQANAVEALWTLSAPDSRALLAAACGSKNNRVAGNAALGLYRLGDVSVIRVLLELAQREDPLYQLSGLWAMGETQDPRFLPFLAERFDGAQGRKRLAITRALGRIRRRERIIEEAGSIQIRVSEARILTGGRRKLGFALWSKHASDLSGLKPTEFALWEGGRLIQNYDVKGPVNVAVLAAGFVAPWFPAVDEPYADALTDGLARCLYLKRRGDLWRIDRYSIEAEPSSVAKVGDRSVLPYGVAIIRPGVSMWHGFLSDRDVLSDAISPGPRERAAPDALLAIERQYHAIGKHAAQRHLFIFLHEKSTANLQDEANLKRLKERVESERIVLHGFAPGAAHECMEFRNLCLAIRGGTFSHTTLDQLAEALEQTYARLLNGFEISYSVPAGCEPQPVTLKVLSEHGTGQVELPLCPPE